MDLVAEVVPFFQMTFKPIQGKEIVTGKGEKEIDDKMYWAATANMLINHTNEQFFFSAPIKKIEHFRSWTNTINDVYTLWSANLSKSIAIILLMMNKRLSTIVSTNRKWMGPWTLKSKARRRSAVLRSIRIEPQLVFF